MLTVQEVAELVKVSDSTVRRWIRDGSLVAYKVGKRGQLRIREKDVEAFLERQRVGVHNTNDCLQEP
jgi:excisionase family DNA binding protein